RQPCTSSNVTFAPVRAAAIAALNPAGPPPQTITSVSSTIGISRAGSGNTLSASTGEYMILLSFAPAGRWPSKETPHNPVTVDFKNFLRGVLADLSDFLMINSFR